MVLNYPTRPWLEKNHMLNGNKVHFTCCNYYPSIQPSSVPFIPSIPAYIGQDREAQSWLVTSVLQEKTHNNTYRLFRVSRLHVFGLWKEAEVRLNMQTPHSQTQSLCCCETTVITHSPPPGQLQIPMTVNLLYYWSLKKKSLQPVPNHKASIITSADPDTHAHWPSYTDVNMSMYHEEWAKDQH